MATTLRSVSPDELSAARAQGERDAQAFIAKHAPDEPVLRCAWAAGVGREDIREAAVMAARAAGVPWKQIGEAMGEHPDTLKSRYTQRGRNRKYAERQRAREQGED